MSNYKPLLDSLTQFLESRLSFRNADLTESVQKIMGNVIKTGNLGSGRLGFVVAQAYEQEARVRAEIVVNDLRQARTSWSPKQLVEAKHELRTTVTDLFKANLSKAAALAQQIGTLQNNKQRIVVDSFLEHSDKVSKAAVSMVEAVISELIAAAANDLAAQGPTDRPSYVFQNTFNGPIASVAQGDASVGEVRQVISSATPQELAEAVSQIIRSLPVEPQVSSEAANARIDLQVAEKELRAGKVPLGLVSRALNTLSKAEDIAIRAPEAIQHIQTLASMLGLS